MDDISKRIRAHRTHGRLAAITIIPTAQQRAAFVWNKTNDTHTSEYTIIVLRSVHDVIAAFPVTGASNREIQRVTVEIFHERTNNIQNALQAISTGKSVGTKRKYLPFQKEIRENRILRAVPPNPSTVVVRKRILSILETLVFFYILNGSKIMWHLQTYTLDNNTKFSCRYVCVDNHRSLIVSYYSIRFFHNYIVFFFTLFYYSIIA